uniref:Uncharacterized protein n=1 Tax=Setaria digitata TaxID=48799 RepID=A0A915PVP6_9BILA
MEALQRMMTRRLDEHSYKRTAKRLVVDEYANDIDFNDKTEEIASINPAYDIIYGEMVRTENNLNSSTTVLPFSATTSSVIISSNSGYHIDPVSTIAATTLNEDPSRTDKLLQKVSLAVRRKLSGTKSSDNEQRNACRDNTRNHDNSKNNRRMTLNDAEKQIRMKSTRKMIDLVNVCAIGRKHRSEHRKLLNEEYGDD